MSQNRLGAIRSATQSSASEAFEHDLFINSAATVDRLQNRRSLRRSMVRLCISWVLGVISPEARDYAYYLRDAWLDGKQPCKRGAAAHFAEMGVNDIWAESLIRWARTSADYCEDPLMIRVPCMCTCPPLKKCGDTGRGGSSSLF